MLSIIIPAYKDPYLQNTIDSLLKNAEADVQIITVLDGYRPATPLKNDPRLKVIKLNRNQGMRGAFNAGLEHARGEFIMKCDSHCAFGPSYDTILTQNCDENWLVIPRRYSLDIDRWDKNEIRYPKDYHYLSFPVNTGSARYGIHLSNQEWPQMSIQKLNDPKYEIDDAMTFQGSCWLANKKYFLNKIGRLDGRKITYGPFADEPQEVGLKYWLSGGANKVIKKAWYAHLNKRPHHYQAGLFTRTYKKDKPAIHGHTWSARHWFNNREPGMVHKLSWLVEKFWPVPSWPEDRKLWVFPNK